VHTEAIRLAMFDMAGTTVNDIVDGLPLVVGATQRAFARHGVDLDPHLVHAQRGKEKREMIGALLQETGQPSSLLEPVYASFLSELERGLLAVREMPGTEATFRFLRQRGIQIAVGSGFPPDVTARIVAHLGWRARGLIDYATTAEEAGGGRPAPNMIHAAMAALGVDDPRHVLKIGDTMMDVLEGKNAGAWTVAVLTGSQTRDQLASVSPDEILPSVADIPTLFATPATSQQDAFA